MPIAGMQAHDIAAHFDLAHLPQNFCVDQFPYYRSLHIQQPGKRFLSIPAPVPA